MSGAEGSAERQGHLGNLGNKSQAELQDLLNRQKKLLSNKRFISKLPDKGKRIQELADNLESRLTLYKDVDGTADLLRRMAIEADQSHRSRAAVVPPGVDAGGDDYPDVLQEIVNRSNVNKQVEDNRTNPATGSDRHTDRSDPTTGTDRRTYINSYEKVVRQVETHQVQNEEPERKFKPNRSVKTKHIHEVAKDKLLKLKEKGGKQAADPTTGNIAQNTVLKEKGGNQSAHPTTGNVTKSSAPEQSRTKNNEMGIEKDFSFCHKKLSTAPRTVYPNDGAFRLKYRYDDSLELDMFKGPLQNKPAKLITVDESVHVLEQQQKHLKEMQAHQAAEKLAQRFHIRIGDVNPEGSSFSKTSYREQEAGDSEHSDIDLDYPD